MTNLPEGWSSVPLRDLLPPEAIEKLPAVMNWIRASRNVSEGKKKLSKLLAPYAAELEAKGVLADYLAYVLLSAALNAPGGFDVNDFTMN